MLFKFEITVRLYDIFTKYLPWSLTYVQNVQGMHAPAPRFSHTHHMHAILIPRASFLTINRHGSADSSFTSEIFMYH